MNTVWLFGRCYIFIYISRALLARPFGYRDAFCTNGNNGKSLLLCIGFLAVVRLGTALPLCILLLHALLILPFHFLLVLCLLGVRSACYTLRRLVLDVVCGLRSCSRAGRLLGGRRHRDRHVGLVLVV
jgi:hypothetical protein